jgi:hypothetical protein
VFSFLIDESELDAFAILVLVFLVDARDKFFEVGQFLFCHGCHFPDSVFANRIILT